MDYFICICICFSDMRLNTLWWASIDDTSPRSNSYNTPMTGWRPGKGYGLIGWSVITSLYSLPSMFRVACLLCSVDATTPYYCSNIIPTTTTTTTNILRIYSTTTTVLLHECQCTQGGQGCGSRPRSLCNVKIFFSRCHSSERRRKQRHLKQHKSRPLLSIKALCLSGWAGGELMAMTMVIMVVMVAELMVNEDNDEDDEDNSLFLRCV